MTSNPSVLAIGAEVCEISEKPSISKHRKEFFESDFEEHLQKILLNGGKPQTKVPDDKLMERFSVNEIKKNGLNYYEFTSEMRTKGWITSGPAFEPKGILRRVKDKISKEHWITDNVAKYSKDSRSFIQQTVLNALHEEQIEIHQYLSYLNENSK